MINISFIGFGNMAQAIAQTLVNNRHYRIFASAPSLNKGITAEGIHTDQDNLSILQDADIIILAVKPVNMPAVLKQISPQLPKQAVLLSVATGLSLSWLEQHCPKQQAIIRSMPNIAIAVQQGATPLIANQWVSATQKQQIEQLFAKASLITWLEDEADIDRFTALSGSGPAYVFFFLEAMIEAAQKLGLDAELASRFSLQTLLGATSLVCNSPLEISALRKKVTSPAGTTAAAIDILQQHQFKELLFQAMQAAFERAKQLGKQ